jgi:hypothetical protein
MGRRPAHKPDPVTRRQVEAMAAYGIPEADIATVIAIDPKTLRRHYRRELDTGHIKANTKVAENLYRRATGESREAVTAAIFWLKTRARWKETTVQESQVTHRYVVRLPTACRDVDEWMRLVASRRDGVPSSERPPMRTIACRRD